MSNAPRRLTTAQTAKLVRAAVKVAFPGVTFAVRSSNYSGGSSIDVTWTDGPQASNVETVVGRFAGADFDGMADCKVYRRILIETPEGPAEPGADFVFCKRHLSPELTARLRERVCRYWGVPVDFPDHLQVPGPQQYVDQLVWRESQATA